MVEIVESYRSSRFSDEFIDYEEKRLDQQVKMNQNIIDMCLSYLDFKGEKQLLDVGCGNGYLSMMISHKNKQGKVIGIDREERYIQSAKQYTSSNSNLDFCVGDCYKTNFDDNKFDICFSRLLFQHLTSPINALKELVRITKDGGIIAVLDIDKSLDCCYPKPLYRDEYYASEQKVKRLQRNDIFIGQKLYGLFKKCGLIDIQVVDASTNICRVSRDAIHDMVELWEKSTTRTHPYIKTGIMSFDQISNYFKSFKEIIKNPESYVSFGNIFTFGTVRKMKEDDENDIR